GSWHRIDVEVNAQAGHPEVVANPICDRNAANHAFGFCRNRAQRVQVVSADANLDRIGDRFAVLELPHVDVGSRDASRERLLKLREDLGGLMRVVDLDDELSIVGCALLWRQRIPEARSASTDEGGDTAKNLPRVTLVCVLAPELLGGF